MTATFNPQRIEAIAFDLDGTLVDSAPDIHAALDAALTAVGLPHFDLATVRGWIGDGPDVLIGQALARLGESTPEVRQRMRREFDRHTLAAPLARGTVYPGVAETLAQLHGRLPLVVISNKPSVLGRAVLEAAGLLPLLAEVQGADTPALRKPAPTMLQAAARRLGLTPDRLLMVGDGPADLGAAQAAGCPVIWAAWGYGHAVEAPRWRADTPQALLRMLIPDRQSARTG